MSAAGSIERIRRYPVKSMRGEDIDRSVVTAAGLLGDRALAIVDAETGKLASAKRPRMWGGLLGFRAAFTGPVTAEVAPPPIRVTFPDGSDLLSDDPDIEQRLAAIVGRKVRLLAPRDEMLFIEEVWHGALKDGAEPYGPVIGEEDGEQLIDVPASLAAPGAFFDAAPIHLVTKATLEMLGRAAPGSSFAVERFRPNLVVDTGDADGFVENGWPDRSLQIGTVRLDVLMPVPRCVMTTLPQGDLPHDPDVLRTVTKNNRIPALAGEYPCVGVYATVAAPGEVRVGDEVRVV